MTGVERTAQNYYGPENAATSFRTGNNGLLPGRTGIRDTGLDPNKGIASIDPRAQREQKLETTGESQ
jgi:hypothetical protein